MNYFAMPENEQIVSTEKSSAVKIGSTTSLTKKLSDFIRLFVRVTRRLFEEDLLHRKVV